MGGGWKHAVTRHAIYHRDEATCAWCGRRPPEHHLTLDHLFPRTHRLWDHSDRFLVTACNPCNASRRSMSVSAYLRRLREDGGSVSAVVERLNRRRWPLNRAAGRARWLSVRFSWSDPLPELEDGIPY